MKTEIVRSDILEASVYESIRTKKNNELRPIRQKRRISVGPYATFCFESYETMWLQIHEMLRIEKGGEAQINDELLAYNPLIPKGSELVATLMFEIEDPEKRKKVLGKLAGIEYKIFMAVGSDKIWAKPEDDQERSREDGKTSAVHFVRFQLSEEKKQKFFQETIVLGFEHPDYGHMATLNNDTKAELEKDLKYSS